MVSRAKNGMIMGGGGGSRVASRVVALVVGGVVVSKRTLNEERNIRKEKGLGKWNETDGLNPKLVGVTSKFPNTTRLPYMFNSFPYLSHVTIARVPISSDPAGIATRAGRC